jgi:branched-chain amino acid transport system substrate-binding protein
MSQTFIHEGAERPVEQEKNAFLLSYAQFAAGQKMTFPMAAARGYDDMRPLAAAIGQADTAQRPSIREALDGLKQTVQGVITT